MSTRINNPFGRAYRPPMTQAEAEAGVATLPRTIAPDILAAAIAALAAGGGLSAPVALTDLATQAEATILGRAAGAGTGVPVALTAAQAGLITNKVRQFVVKPISANISGNNAIPFDDTIPQNTEGVAWITSDSFTPVSADSIIIIQFAGVVQSVLASEPIWALFIDSVANAIDADLITSITAAGKRASFSLTSKQLATNTTARTYSLRVGAGTTVSNYNTTTDDFGGIAKRGTMTIWEIAP